MLWRFSDHHLYVGPKIYNAYASVLYSDHSGSTRLHLDAADAVNIMVYAGQDVSGAKGYATWQIFSQDDRNRIREYLRERHHHANDTPGDPIHNQSIYLTPDMLKALAKQRFGS